ncbi:recombination protein O N-terminal domain-containing protein [Akkermansiaceae bacterium]|nr:recombination protein O N-terminal domain-containing protein [Akkermansiaceae bacterium]
MFATEAILIRTTRLTDTSLIVHWFTLGEGLVKTVAKGALRPKSPFAGKLDLFFSGEIGVARARAGELHILREVAISNWREGLRRKYESALMAGYFCQLVEAAVEPGHADAEMHDLLRRGLDHLDSEEPGLRAMLHFEKQMAGLLGISGGRASVADSLLHHLGRLPASRKQLLERMGGD